MSSPSSSKPSATTPGGTVSSAPSAPVAASPAVQFVPPSVWEPLFSVLDVRARGILTLMHNRHVGITPELAAGLVTVLAKDSLNRRTSALWERTLERLAAQLRDGETPAGVRQVSNRHGLLSKSMPTYFVLRLALPLIQRACAKLGQTFLFAEEPMAPEATVEAYQAYAGQLERVVAELIAEKASWNTFWRDRALTLAGHSRRLALAKATPPGLSESDAADAALFLKLRTELPPVPRRFVDIPQVKQPPPRQSVRRRKESGIEGIHKTTRLDDLDDILKTELALPPLFLQDRVLNEGFFTVWRPPRREQSRDVLLAAILPPFFSNSLHRAFLKACFFDLSVRFGQMLCERRMLDSEFRFIEGNDLQQARASVFQLQDLDQLQLVGGAAFRQDFRIGLGWLPEFIDRQARFDHAVVAGSDFIPREPIERHQEWIQRVWNAQRDGRSETDETLRLSEFALIHLMIFLPAQLRPKGEEGRAFSAQVFQHFQSRLFAGAARHGMATVTWVPEVLQPSGTWLLDAAVAMGQPIFPRHAQAELAEAETGEDAPAPEELKLTEPQFAGGLVGAWLEQLNLQLRRH